MENFLGFIWDLIFTRGRVRGPLEVVVQVDGEHLVLLLNNCGKSTLAFAAIKATDASGKDFYPVCDLEVSAKLKRNEEVVCRLDLQELQSSKCQSLMVLDTTGKKWKVPAFDPACCL